MLRRSLLSCRAIRSRIPNSCSLVSSSIQQLTVDRPNSNGGYRSKHLFFTRREDLPQELDSIWKAAHVLIEQENVLSINQWVAVEHMAPFWLKYETFESARVTFRLLDRLEMELRRHNSTRSPLWINEKLVEEMVDHWFRVSGHKKEPVDDSPRERFLVMKSYLKEIFSERQSSSHQTAPLNYTPQEVFSKVRSYLKVFLRVKWTSSIAFKISAAHAYNSCGSAVDPTFCGEIVSVTVEEWQKTRDSAMYPTTALFQTAFYAWSKVGRSSVASKRSLPSLEVDELLDLMRTIGLVPTNENYNTCIKVIASSGCRESAYRAQELLLEDMYADFRSSGDEKWSWSGAFSGAIEAWSQVDDSCTFENIKLLLGRYKEFQSAGYVCPKDDALAVYNAALHALSTVGTLESAQKAREIFQEIIHFSKPTHDTYVWLVSTLSKAGCFEEANEILTSIQHLPPAAHFGVLRGISDMDHPMVVPQTYKVIRILSTGLHSGPRANTRVYNQFLASILGSGCRSSSAWRDKTDSVLEVVGFMKKSWSKGEFDRRPDRKTYLQIIRCFALQGNYVFSFHWFEAMVKDYQNGNESAAPTVVECNQILEALVNSDDNHAAEKAEHFLQHIQNINSKRKSLKPNVESYEKVISCLSKKGRKDAAMRALKLLKSMAENKLAPNSACVNMVIKSLAESGSPDHAEEVLWHAWSFEDAVEPSICSINSCIKALAISGSPKSSEKCERIVSRMHSLYANGLDELRPNLETYEALMTSYTLGKDQNAHYHIRKILSSIQELEQDGLRRPIGIDIYRSFIVDWEHSDNPKKGKCIQAIEDEIDRWFGETLHTDSQMDDTPATS